VVGWYLWCCTPNSCISPSSVFFLLPPFSFFSFLCSHYYSHSSGSSFLSFIFIWKCFCSGSGPWFHYVWTGSCFRCSKLCKVIHTWFKFLKAFLVLCTFQVSICFLLMVFWNFSLLHGVIFHFVMITDVQWNAKQMWSFSGFFIETDVEIRFREVWNGYWDPFHLLF